jgi:hypothetical protein
MLRARVSARYVGTAVAAVAAAAGIALGAYSLGSAPMPTTPQTTLVGQDTTGSPLPADGKDAPTSTPTTESTPAAESTPATDAAKPTDPAPMTLDEVKAIAAKAASAPGRVIEWDEDHEPTGLRYDVTLLHADGSTTDVEVDTVTGQVTSIDFDDNRD